MTATGSRHDWQTKPVRFGRLSARESCMHRMLAPRTAPVTQRRYCCPMKHDPLTVGDELHCPRCGRWHPVSRRTPTARR